MQYVNSKIYSGDILDNRESLHNENKLRTHGLDMGGGDIVAGEEYKIRSLSSHCKYSIPLITHNTYGGLESLSTHTSQNKRYFLKYSSRLAIDGLSLSTKKKYNREFIRPVTATLLALYKNLSAIFLHLTLKLITRIPFASKKGAIKGLFDYTWTFERIIRSRPYALNLRSLIAPNC